MKESKGVDTEPWGTPEVTPAVLQSIYPQQHTAVYPIKNVHLITDKSIFVLKSFSIKSLCGNHQMF